MPRDSWVYELVAGRERGRFSALPVVICVEDEDGDDLYGIGVCRV